MLTELLSCSTTSKKVQSIRCICAVFSLLFLAVFPAWAQIDTGTITGRVADSTGAVVPGAKVTITQTETNFQSVTETNSEGIYRVGSLRPGPYRITVEAAGFKSFIRENAVLRTGDTMAINATLEVGAVSESIEVTAAVPLLETETSATGQVVSGDYQYALPLYQRNVKAIMYLVPGMTMNGFGYAGQMNNFHTNGLRSGYIGYFEDGALATGTDNNGLTSDTILNAVEEVKVITSALPAEYGHSAGGAITVV
ncbi:MAG TPA: carboxypeptidase-like regulatory domain-containing protein, partial [Bryobacteraceae bacterium]|nr:carboxypeptidase-like regulatory domain-containing protein [Bryobacteraceae bacterium]